MYTLTPPQQNPRARPWRPIKQKPASYKKLLQQAITTEAAFLDADHEKHYSRLSGVVTSTYTECTLSLATSKSGMTSRPEAHVLVVTTIMVRYELTTAAVAHALAPQQNYSYCTCTDVSGGFVFLFNTIICSRL